MKICLSINLIWFLGDFYIYSFGKALPFYITDDSPSCSADDEGLGYVGVWVHEYYVKKRRRSHA